MSGHFTGMPSIVVRSMFQERLRVFYGNAFYRRVSIFQEFLAFHWNVFYRPLSMCKERLASQAILPECFFIIVGCPCLWNV